MVCVSVIRGAGAAAAAADQRDLDNLRAGSMDVGQGHAGQGGDGSNAAGGFDKLATSGKRIR
jgi:hypothetical protein